MVGKVGGLSVVAPDPTRATSAAEDRIAIWEGYKNTIDSEAVKFFINTELVTVMQEKKKWQGELAKITEPLVESRRQALAAKQAAENLFARLFGFLETGERLLKGEIVRWEQLVERKRLEAEAEVKRKAEEERRQLEEQARLQAEEAARKNLEEQERAAELDRQGQQQEAENIRLRAEVQLEAAAEQVDQILEDAEQTVNNAIVPSTSVKMKGTALTGKWVAEIQDLTEVFAGILSGETPFSEVVRVKQKGRLVPFGLFTGNPADIEAVEINLPWFQDKARQQQGDFAYRGMKARFVQDLRVTA